MPKPLSLAAAALAMTATALVPTTAADAQRYGRQGYADDRAYRDGDHRGGREYRGRDRSYSDYRARQKCRSPAGCSAARSRGAATICSAPSWAAPRGRSPAARSIAATAPAIAAADLLQFRLQGVASSSA